MEKRKRARAKMRARARGRGFPMAIVEKGAEGGKKGELPGLGAASP